ACLPTPATPRTWPASSTSSWRTRPGGGSWGKRARRPSTGIFTPAGWPRTPWPFTESTFDADPLPHHPPRGVRRHRHGRHRPLRQLLPLHGGGRGGVPQVPGPVGEDGLGGPAARLPPGGRFV